MPDTSTLFLSAISSVPISKEPLSSFFPLRRPPLFASQSQVRSLRFVRRSSGSGRFLGDDAFGPYPWESSDPDESSVQWVQEEKITLFTADGLIQFGGKTVPRRVSSTNHKQGKLKVSSRFQRFHESKYMDPNQSLCLGALFDIAATNGLDMGRKLCILGFCRSIEMLSDVVEDTVLEHVGSIANSWFLNLVTRHSCYLARYLVKEVLGEIVSAKKASRGGLQEKLTMTVAVPLLWGIPPASETLRFAVRSGGGIVDKVYWRWDFL